MCVTGKPDRRRRRAGAPASSTSWSSERPHGVGAVAFAARRGGRGAVASEDARPRATGSATPRTTRRSSPARERWRAKIRRHQIGAARGDRRDRGRHDAAVRRPAAGASASCSSSACAREQAQGADPRVLRRAGRREVAGVPTRHRTAGRDPDASRIIGAGTMGSGIAMACANAGLRGDPDRRDRRGARRAAWRRSGKNYDVVGRRAGA